jgi:hypothetical protein
MGRERMELMERRERKRSAAVARSSKRSGPASPQGARSMNDTPVAVAQAAPPAGGFLEAAQRAEAEIDRFVENHQVTDRDLDLVMSV